MPYQVEQGGGFLPAILGVLAAAKQGKVERQQRDLQNKYTQAQIQSMQANQQRTADQDALANRKAGVNVQYPTQMAPAPNADPLTSARAYLHMADYYDQQGATDLAKQYRDNAASILGAYYQDARTAGTHATTNLTKAKTVTEEQRPDLVRAQTDYTRAGVPLRNAQTKRITTIQPQQFQEQQQNQMQRAQMAIAAAQARAAEAQAAAWERMEAHFAHEDATRSQTAKSSAQKSAHADNIKRNTAQAEVLRTKINRILKANPAVSNDQLRDAARQDGYPDAVIDLVVPKGPGERNFKKTSAKGTSFGWGTP